MNNRFLLVFSIMLSSCVGLLFFYPVHGAAVPQTSGSILASRVAPGELLPISMKLLNFGTSSRVDVLVQYTIYDIHARKILAETETVAVETSSNFVKLLQIPSNLTSGDYTLEASVLYKDQKVPAVSSYQFTVEKKIIGLFLSEFILYSIVTGGVVVISLVILRLSTKRTRKSRLVPQNYDAVPKNVRLFYELISDTVSQMRLHIGDEALHIAAGVDGLAIDANGRVMHLDNDPAYIMATLVKQCEERLGRSVNFAFHNDENSRKERVFINPRPIIQPTNPPPVSRVHTIPLSQFPHQNQETNTYQNTWPMSNEPNGEGEQKNF